MPKYPHPVSPVVLAKMRGQLHVISDSDQYLIVKVGTDAGIELTHREAVDLMYDLARALAYEVRD